MRALTLALVTSAAVAGATSAASAADLIINPAPAPVAVIENMSAVDWSGPYAGLFVSGQTDSVFGLGADLGVNVLMGGGLLAGVEGNVAWLNDDSWQGQVHGKLGIASDSFAFYGLAGVGANSETDAFAPLGLGAEFMLSDNLSLKGEYQYQWDFDDSSESAHVARIGLNWHF